MKVHRITTEKGQNDTDALGTAPICFRCAGNHSVAKCRKTSNQASKVVSKRTSTPYKLGSTVPKQLQKRREYAKHGKTPTKAFTYKQTREGYPSLVS